MDMPETTTTTPAEGEGWTPAEIEMLLGRARRLDQHDAKVLKHLGHAHSKRGKRRALALLLGHDDADGCVRVYRLRSACAREGLYDSRGDRANFTQDMRKDCVRGLFAEHTYKNGKEKELAGYWMLTDKGRELAAAYARAVDPATPEARLQAVKRQVSRSIVLRPKAPRCPWCREDVIDTDKAVCDGCGSQAHASCLTAFKRDTWRSSMSCALASVGVSCYGRYRVVAQPELSAPETIHQDECSVCYGVGSISRPKLSCRLYLEHIVILSDEARDQLACELRHACECDDDSGLCRKHSSISVWTPCACAGI